MGCECFDPRVSFVALHKAFKRSPQEGIQAIGLELNNLKTRAEEIFWPKSAYFKVNFEEKGGRLFWERYTRPVVYCLMRGISLLERDGADPEKIRQEKIVLEVFRLLEPRLLELRNGEAIQSLALRDVDPTAGASFVQIERKNGRLIGQYRLLPFDELSEMEKFTSLVERDGERLDLGIELGDDLSPLVVWAVKGNDIDFKQDLQGMIQKSLSVNQELGVPIHVIESMSGGAGTGVGYVHLGSGHELGEEVITEGTHLRVTGFAQSASAADLRTEHFGGQAEILVPPHPRGGVEVVIQDWVELVKPQERKSVKGVKVGDIEEVITEGTEVTESTAKVVAPTVTRMIPVNEVIEDTVSHLRGVMKAEVSESEDVAISDVHLGSGREDAAEKFVSRFARNKPAEYQECESVKAETDILVPPQVTGMIPVNNEVVEDIVSVSHLRGVIKIIELVKLPQPVAAIQAEKHQEHSVMQPHPRGGVEVVAEVVAPMVEPQPVAVNQVDQEERHKKFKSVKIEVFNYDSVLSVIKETFNKQVKKLKSINSILRSNARISRQLEIKTKLIWLTQQMSNVVADQLMGRNTGEPVLGWLVHGWAMMQFDGIEEKQKMKRFSLSPVRIWADRVTGVVRRVKDKFVRTGFSVYKQLFAII